MHKKILCLILAIILFLTVMGCNNIPNENNITSFLTEEMTPQHTENRASEVRNTLIIYTPTPTVEITPTPSKEAISLKNIEEFTQSLKHTANGVMYENSEYGFSLTFPDYWGGSFLIYGNEILKVSFIGKSETSMKVIENENYGLFLFWIVSENNLKHIRIYDDSVLMGTVDDVKYYYVTATDCEIGALSDELDDYDEGKSIYQTNEAEIELVRKDFEQYEKMRYDVEEILTSFSDID